jgi:hypothetical protein
MDHVIGLALFAAICFGVVLGVLTACALVVGLGIATA